MRAVFFSSIAHELRTPLNSIIPILEMILKEFLQTPTPARFSKLIKIVLNSSIHLQNVIEDALDISRLENNNFRLFLEMFDLRATLNEVCDIMRFQIEQKKLQLNLFIDKDVPRKVYCDAKRYKQVLFNMIGNAVKFTFKGSISVRIGFDDNVLTTIVEDTGIGMKEEDLQKLFRFFGYLQSS